MPKLYNILLLISLIITLLIACQPTDSENVVCKIAISVPDLSINSVDHINKLIANSQSQKDLSGWTLYPVYGSWRADETRVFTHTTSMVIEIMGKNSVMKTSFDLAHEFEQKLNQKLALVYCTDLRNTSPMKN